MAEAMERERDSAPSFSALDQDGTAWSLADHLDGKPLVVY
jgi:peroxiredoxin